MAITFSPAEILSYYQTRVPRLKFSKAREWRGPCPVHNGTRDSFSVDSGSGMAVCHSQCGKGWDLIGLEMALSNCEFPQAKAWVFTLIGRSSAEMTETKTFEERKARIFECTYHYEDEKGKILYEVVRFKQPKGFSQRRPLGNNKYAYDLRGVRIVPYRLPALIAATEIVFIVEGEKDADALTRLGLVATCNSMGAGKFTEELVPYFQDKVVAIIPDNDSIGMAHALDVGKKLHGVAKSIKILTLPGLPPKGDVSDYLATGKSVAQIRAIYENAPDFDPTVRVQDRFITTLRTAYERAGGNEKFWAPQHRAVIDTPFDALSKALNGGLINGEVYVIGGATGEGKTSIALQFGLHYILRQKGFLIFSMEMSDIQIYHRLICIHGGIDYHDYCDRLHRKDTSPGFLKLQKSLYNITEQLISHLPIVNRMPIITPRKIVEETLLMKERYERVDLVIVDHLQLMNADEDKRSEYERYTAISRALKQTAVEADVPLLVTSQVSRSHSREKRTELELSDFRATGAIEEDAAAAMLLFPDKQDLETARQEGRQDAVVKAWLKLAKNRYGPSNILFPLIHEKCHTRFREYKNQNLWDWHKRLRNHDMESNLIM